MTKEQTLSNLLSKLEIALKQQGLWTTEPLNKELLESTEPFCHDTLKAEQWLQFVFIEKLSFLIKHHVPLPNNCSVTPYIKESLKEQPKSQAITDITLEIDNLLS